jgi:hypothetical protein
VKCWISLRDVAPGQNYQEAIVQAIETAQGIVFLFSEHSGRSGEIKKELSIGASINVPVFPVRLAPIAPSGALRYELAIRQWIDIFPHRSYALGKLAETIKSAINAPATAEASDAPLTRAPPARPVAPARSTAAKPRPKPREPIVASGSKEFESIRALLARHIGPIAKVFIERAATEAKTPAEFCEKLAAHVSVPSERNAFLQAVRAQLAAKS